MVWFCRQGLLHENRLYYKKDVYEAQVVIMKIAL
jgi:hypothetical protein